MGAVGTGGTLEMCLHISCPKVGLQLLTGEEWMALTPRVPGSPFHILEAGVRDVQLNLPAAGVCCSLQTHHRPNDCQKLLSLDWMSSGSTIGLAVHLHVYLRSPFLERRRSLAPSHLHEAHQQGGDCALES